MIFVPHHRRARRAAALPEEVGLALRDAPPPPLATPLLAAAAAGVIVAFGLAIAAWSSLPGRIPSHFGSDGQVDGWGGKGTLAVFPFMALIIFGMMTVINRFPATFNYAFKLTRENARRQAALAMLLIAWLRLSMIWMLVYLELTVIAAARNGAHRLDAAFLPSVLVCVVGAVAAYFAAAWRAR